jgi:branched-chain amino acid transport system ATP-binding protein
VRELTVRFGGLVALDRVSIDVAGGSILGIIGPNGAGKTTLFDAITGLVGVESGSVLLGDDDVGALSPHARAHAGLGRSFQDGRLFGSLTVAECIGVALHRHIPVGNAAAAVAGAPWTRARARRARQRTDAIMERMGLEAFADAFVRELSTGTRRLVDLACAIAHHPDVLLLDEPSSGIAQKEVEALGPLLRRVRDEAACTMLLIEHDIPLVTSLADELVALETGRVITRGVPADVVKDPEVVRAYLGTDRVA